MVATGRPFTIRRPGRWLVAEFTGEPGSWNVLSWALVNGGFQRTPGVAWLYLKEDEIAVVDSPREWMAAQMRTAGLAGYTGFLATCNEHCYVEAESREMECRCWAVGTVSLGHALRAGDSAGPVRPDPGAINLMLVCSHALATNAALELIALASEAKTLAVTGSGVASRRSGEPATGAGTDYVAIAWPALAAYPRLEYASKRTAIGSAARRAAYQAVAGGIRMWRHDQGEGW